MTVPVIDMVARGNSALRITVMTSERCVPFFAWMPENVTVKGYNLKSYPGVGGLNRLYKDISQEQFDAVLDLHDVLRTKYLRLRFSMAGVKTYVIDKGRRSKKRLLGHGLDGKHLTPTANRYKKVFVDAGITSFCSKFKPVPEKQEQAGFIKEKGILKGDGERWVGIAPFAAHDGKVYPLDKMLCVAKCLSADGVKVFLFGAGKNETDILTQWTGGNIIMASRYATSLREEIVLISLLDCMVSMDSANMHIASLAGTPVVSLWGATHPKAGFMGWGQDEANAVSLPLECRPCSVYGNKPCKFNDYRCLQGISPEQVTKKVEDILKGKNND